MPVPHRGAGRGLWGIMWSPRSPGDSEPAGNFGDQLIMDWQDEVVGRVSRLLINASSISVGELPGLMAEFGGGGVSSSH